MNILAIGAHFDDIELGCGGTLARHNNKKNKIYALVATDSAYSNYEGNLIRSAKIAKKEGIKGLKTLGVKEIFFGKFKTFKIDNLDKLNRQIIKILNTKKIDLVFTHWSGDIHIDHSQVSKASLHSCRHVKKILMYRSNWYSSNLDFSKNYYVDISDFWKNKEQSINCHTSELKRTKKRWIDFWKNEALNTGQEVGKKYAESFQIIKWID